MVVNSTPLWVASEDVSEPQPISPAMLTTQKESPREMEEGLATEEHRKEYGPKRWGRIQQLGDIFWNEWRQQYLCMLHDQRRKWTKECRNLGKGDVVLIREKWVPRYKWPLGMVVGVKTSDDGLVRSATIKPLARGGRSKAQQAPRDRPIHELALIQEASLPSELEEGRVDLGEHLGELSKETAGPEVRDEEDEQIGAENVEERVFPGDGLGECPSHQ